jgi:hypothetical protein
MNAPGLKLKRPMPKKPPGTATPQDASDSAIPGIDGNPWESMFEPIGSLLERADKEPEPSWLIPDVVPDTGKVFIVAEPNAGKTWLALLAAKEGALSGRDVFFVEEEGQAVDLAKRLRSLRMVDGSISIAIAKGVLIDDEACRVDLVKRATAATRPIFVFDPFATLHTGDENNTPDMTRVARYLSELTRANPQSLIVICHHMGKNTEHSAIHRNRGSGVLGGFADYQLNLVGLDSKGRENHVGFRVHVAKARSGPKNLKRDFHLNLETGIVDTNDPREETDEQLDELIRRALRKAPMGLPRSKIRESVKRNNKKVNERITAMVDNEDLVELDGPKKAKLIALPPEPIEDEEALEGDA